MTTVQTAYGQGNYSDQGYTTATAPTTPSTPTTTTTAPGAPNTGFWAQPAVQDTVVGGSSVLIVAAIALVVATFAVRHKRRSNRG